MEAHTQEYLENATWRREELEASMWRPDLPYAKKRLDAYALPSGGWDALPVATFDVQSVGPQPKRIVLGDVTPTTPQEWQAAGEEVFWWMPMRRDPYLEVLADRPDLWPSFGIQTDAHGNARGLVRYNDVLGVPRVAVTCGFCHADGGHPGKANTDLDFGGARAALGATVGGEWPVGTIDVTDDNVDDPVAIPDIYNVEHQQFINHSASVKVHSPASLAIRFETQFVEGHAMMARVPRSRVWALTQFVIGLAPTTTTPADGANQAFEKRCGTCHLADEAYGGGLVPAELLNTPTAAAFSPMRGTGYLKVPTLLGVSQRTSFLSDASMHSLVEVVASGHPYGEPPSPDESQDILNFLSTL